MYYDFIEIGTSDFDTLIQKANKSTFGISIDPISLYLDALPNLMHCRKICCAISDESGAVTVYYIEPVNLALYNIPNWIRGCNSIGHPHPSVVAVLKALNLDAEKLIRQQLVYKKTLLTVMSEENVTGVYFLKVDTEGHDAVILKCFFNNTPNHLLPHELIFESNTLSDSDEIQTLIAIFLNP